MLTLLQCCEDHAGNHMQKNCYGLSKCYPNHQAPFLPSADIHPTQGGILQPTPVPPLTPTDAKKSNFSFLLSAYLCGASLCSSKDMFGNKKLLER